MGWRLNGAAPRQRPPQPLELAVSMDTIDYVGLEVVDSRENPDC